MTAIAERLAKPRFRRDRGATHFSFCIFNSPIFVLAASCPSGRLQKVKRMTFRNRPIIRFDAAPDKTSQSWAFKSSKLRRNSVPVYPRAVDDVPLRRDGGAPRRRMIETLEDSR
ncbi:hypothetical protein [Sphingopyxis sp.]|uniref:hypothetical protein n=1 Tax=Sphingopyxis sp. TaxID=1908224 RepID=UPI003D10C1DD